MNQLTRREKSSKRIGPVRNDNDLLVYDDFGKSFIMNFFRNNRPEFPPSAMDADSLLLTSRVTPTISNTTFRHGDFSSKRAKINIRKALRRDGISSRKIKIVSKEVGYLMASTEAK